MSEQKFWEECSFEDIEEKFGDQKESDRELVQQLIGLILPFYESCNEVQIIPPPPFEERYFLYTCCIEDKYLCSVALNNGTRGIQVHNAVDSGLQNFTAYLSLFLLMHPKSIFEVTHPNTQVSTVLILQCESKTRVLTFENFQYFVDRMKNKTKIKILLPSLQKSKKIS